MTGKSPRGRGRTLLDWALTKDKHMLGVGPIWVDGL